MPPFCDGTDDGRFVGWDGWLFSVVVLLLLFFPVGCSLLLLSATAVVLPLMADAAVHCGEICAAMQSLQCCLMQVQALTNGMENDQPTDVGPRRRRECINHNQHNASYFQEEPIDETKKDSRPPLAAIGNVARQSISA